MNEQDRAEFYRLRAVQRDILRQIQVLENRIDGWIDRVDPPFGAAPEFGDEERIKPRNLPGDEPPPLPVAPAYPVAAVAPKPVAKPSVLPAPVSLPTRNLQPNEAKPIPSPVAPTATRSTPPSEKKESLELKVGTFWLVRVGILILLTGFAFLANYTYQNFVAKAGPLVKLTLLYLSGGALTAVGVVLQKRGENLKNYARVLIAGGIAALYYTTYAAHFVEHLQVIKNPIVAGILLLGFGGGIAFYADRRRSQPTAFLAILLAFYTAAINPVGTFTLFSNLLLAALALSLMRRHQWSKLSFASLAATYASFGYWRFFRTGTFLVPHTWDQSAFWIDSSFLLAYWGLFTLVTFWTEEKLFSPQERTAFLSVNNGALFGYFAPAFGAVYPQSFWLFPAAFGAVLLGLSVLSRRLKPKDPWMEGSYLAQGIAMITVGITARFTGYHLALALAVESAVLLELSAWRMGLLYRVGSVLSAGGAFCLALRSFDLEPETIKPVGSALAMIYLFNAWRYRRLRNELSVGNLNALSFVFSAMSAIAGGFALKDLAGWDHLPAACAIVALVMTASLYLLRLTEAALFGQAYWIFGFALWCIRDRGQIDSANSGILFLTTLGLMHWWKKQRVLPSDELGKAMEMLSSAMATTILFLWFQPLFGPNDWMVVTGGLALAQLLYGLLTGSWIFAGMSIFFTSSSVITFFSVLSEGEGSWQDPLLAIAGICLQLLVQPSIQSRTKDEMKRVIGWMGATMRWVLFGMISAWICRYVSEPWTFNTLTGVATMVFAYSLYRHRRNAFALGVAFTGVALLEMWWRLCALHSAEPDHLAGLLLILATPHLSRRWFPDRNFFTERLQCIFDVSGLMTLWFFTTRWVSESNHGLLITMSWSILALIVLATGFLLKERNYRLFGLAILVASVGRVFLIDVWKIETIYRILSFIVLGVVLLMLGFLYNRFADRLRQWL